MKYIKIIIAIWLLAIIWIGFYQTNLQNYEKYIKIRDNYIKHPENLPTSTSAKLTSFWFQNVKADWYWLNAIQYIWGNAIGSEYKKYLYQMLDVITDLNPYFEHPYIIGQLLLPSTNERYENFSQDQIAANIKQGETLGLKWIKTFCDTDKIKLIEQESNLLKIWTQEKYKNPCKSYDIPYSLAFVYWHYLNDPLSASKYYKIASANEDAIEWAKTMAAIMQWKWGDREKSFFMFLNLAKYIAWEDQACLGFSQQFEQLWAAIFQNKVALNGTTIEWINIAREQTFWKFNEENEDEQLDDTNCITYINKAVREMNLYYIEAADAKYRLDNNNTPSKHAKQLYNDGYIDYLPQDFQQYEDYEVIYEYSPDTDTYDYSNGIYK